jgi:hypothetical protein
MPVEVDLSPKAAEKVAREAAIQSFDNAARSIMMEWCMDRLDGKQVQRWSEKLGQRVVRDRERAVEAYQRGQRQACKQNDPQLLVIEIDGGRVQNRLKNEDGSRWREDKLVTVSTALRGNPKARKKKRREPIMLVTTHVATMGDARKIGPLARVEAEKRMLCRAQEVVVLGDGAAWIDGVCEDHFACHARIVDYYHAAEHVHDCAKAICPEDETKQRTLAEQWKTLLWKGQIQELIEPLKMESARLGEPLKDDGPDHPRRVLHRNAGYFTKHAQHMKYPQYRRRGWPIGSGTVESGMKQLNKRMKGTDQFWNTDGAESILALRGQWLSQDGRWEHYWLRADTASEAA